MSDKFKFPKSQGPPPDPSIPSINSLEADTLYDLGGSVGRSLGQVVGWVGVLRFPPEARCVHCGCQAVMQRLSKTGEWVELCDLTDCLHKEWQADEARRTTE